MARVLADSKVPLGRMDFSWLGGVRAASVGGRPNRNPFSEMELVLESV
mgnify:CR=1 FL=1